MNFNRRNTLLAVAALVLVLGSGWYLFARSGKDQGKGDDHGAPPVLITSDRAARHPFVNVLEAEGSAHANESIELTAKATETIRALHFTDGQSVKAGAVVAELTASEQTADEAAARAALREQEQAYRRSTKLAEQGYVSKAGGDAAKAALDTAAAKVVSLKSRMTDRAIMAPFSGVLGLRRVSVGSLVKPGDIITTLDDISKIKVDFTVHPGGVHRVPVVDQRVSSHRQPPVRARIARCAWLRPGTRVRARSPLNHLSRMTARETPGPNSDWTLSTGQEPVKPTSDCCARNSPRFDDTNRLSEGRKPSQNRTWDRTPRRPAARESSESLCSPQARGLRAQVPTIRREALHGGASRASPAGFARPGTH